MASAWTCQRQHSPEPGPPSDVTLVRANVTRFPHQTCAANLLLDCDCFH
jgi:hypothetical protein